MSAVPEIPVDDGPLFARIARQCQGAGRSLGDKQDRLTVLDMTPQEAMQLAAVLRCASGPVSFTDKEKAVLVDLLNVASMSSVFLPAYHRTELCATSLVSILLSAGNLMSEAADRVLQKESVQ